MVNIVLDTGPLADFLHQYFGAADRGHVPFRRGFSLSEGAADTINRIVRTFYADEPARALVRASVLAFAEIVRKWDIWDTLAGNEVAPHQLQAFLAAPPGWFAVESVDESLVEFFNRVPATVQMDDGSTKNVEWADAIHAATALSHDTGPSRCVLAVEDRRVRKVPQLAGRCV